MSLHIHQLDINRHTRFLAEGRQDPITKETLKAGDHIAICAGCKTAYLADSWNFYGKCVCGTTETLRHVPYSEERLNMTQLPPRLRLRLPAEVPLEHPSHTGRRFFEYGVIGAIIGLVLRGLLAGVGHFDDWLFNYYNYVGLNDKDVTHSFKALPYWIIIPVFLSLIASFYLVYRVIKK